MLSEKVLDIVQKNDIEILDRQAQDGDYYRELSFYSPEGEDVSITIWYDGTENGFIKSFCKYAEDFDADEHAAMWINARNTVGGVPQSIRTLIDDADAIKDFLLEVAEELEDYDSAINEYKCTITITDDKQTFEQDFYVEAKSFEKAIKQIEQDLNIDLS